MNGKLFRSTVLLIVMVLTLAPVSYADEQRIIKLISLNGRLAPTQGSEIFSVGDNKVLVVTDIVIQNRNGGDAPVNPDAFSRIVLGPGFDNPSNIGPGDFFLTVVGNDTLNLHFSTGRVVEERFRVFNVGNSTAPHIEFLVNGFITRKTEFYK
jgi:hypothetical protein